MPLFVDWKDGTSGTRYADELPHSLALPPREDPDAGALLPVGHVLLLDGTSPCFDPGRVTLAWDEERFRLSEAVAEVTAGGFDHLVGTLPPGRLFDGPVVRLAGLSRQGGGWTLRLQGAGYFDYVRSNLMMDWQGPSGRLRDLVHHAGRLPAPEASPLADALGISVLLVTADGGLIVQRRAPTVMVWPGALGPSAAGMAGPEDFDGAATLADLCPLREAVEELGLPAETMGGIEPRFLGLTREFVRGGAPELFYAAHLPLSEAELRAASARAEDGDEYTELLFLPLGDDRAVRAALDGAASTPLLAGLVLLHRAGAR
jgi:hypothetical protein